MAQDTQLISFYAHLPLWDHIVSAAKPESDRVPLPHGDSGSGDLGYCVPLGGQPGGVLGVLEDLMGRGCLTSFVDKGSAASSFRAWTLESLTWV